MKKIFTNQSSLPKLTQSGFLKVKIPPNVYDMVLEAYNVLKQIGAKPETVDIVTENTSMVYHYSQLNRLFIEVQNKLRPIHEWWCGEKLVNSFIYGIRSYRKGAKLDNHYDWTNSHHVSSIIIVDKDLNKKNDWPLQFQSHDGEWNHICADPGEMILYESAKCKHGRPDVFEGNYFNNMFIHYRLKNWKFIGSNLTNPNEVNPISDPEGFNI